MNSKIKTHAKRNEHCVILHADINGLLDVLIIPINRNTHTHTHSHNISHKRANTCTCAYTQHKTHTYPWILHTRVKMHADVHTHTKTPTHRFFTQVRKCMQMCIHTDSAHHQTTHTNKYEFIHTPPRHTPTPASSSSSCTFCFCVCCWCGDTGPTWILALSGGELLCWHPIFAFFFSLSLHSRTQTETLPQKNYVQATN